jgi:glycosyltransferase involved in cell wall biosynthesis
VRGGIAHGALACACDWAARGHDVHLLASVGPIDRRLLDAGVNVICLNQFDILSNTSRIAAGAQGLWNPSAASAIEKILTAVSREKIVVHVHGWAKALSTSFIPKVLSRAIPIILTIHDYTIACPNAGFFNYVRREQCALTPLSVKCVTTNCDVRSYPQKLWRVARQLTQRFPGRTPSGIETFVTISKLSRSIIEEFLPESAHVVNIGNPISIEQSEPIDSARNQAYAYVGRLSVEKGPLLAAEAARRAGKKLIFIGDGYMRAELEAHYPECKITGWMDSISVRKELGRTRALLFPSLWAEGQPLVVQEASALGIPSIVADTCSARDSVRNGESGLWFKGGDVEDLALKLTLMQNDDLASKMGRFAYDLFWSAPPGITRHTDQLEDLYSETIGRQSRLVLEAK